MPFGAIFDLLSGAGEQQGASVDALAQLRNFDVAGPFGAVGFNPAEGGGGSIDTSLSPALAQALIEIAGLRGQFGELLGDAAGEEFDIESLIASEISRGRSAAAPQAEALRSSARGRLFGSGRLGLGAGGGVAGAPFQPELAALEEGFARADSSIVDQAINRGFAVQTGNRADRSDLVSQVLALLSSEMGLAGLPAQFGQLGINARPPAQAVQGTLDAGDTRQAASEGFFGKLINFGLSKIPLPF